MVIIFHPEPEAPVHMQALYSFFKQSRRRKERMQEKEQKRLVIQQLVVSYILISTFIYEQTSSIKDLMRVKHCHIHKFLRLLLTVVMRKMTRHQHL